MIRAASGWLAGGVLASAMFLVGCEFVGAPGESDDAIDADAGSDTDASDRAPLENDVDDDGVIDTEDNCVDHANPLQGDEDGDTIGDVCDNCPANANPDQSDIGEINAQESADGVGDACDPRPDKGGDRIAHFNGFLEPLDAQWQSLDGSWEVSGGRLTRTDTSGVGTIYWSGSMLSNSVTETRVTIGDLGGGGGDPMHGVGVIAHYDDEDEEGYGCVEANNSQASTNLLAMYTFTPPQIIQIGSSTSASPAMSANMVIDFRFAALGGANRIECDRESGGSAASRGQNVFNHTSGYVGLHSYRTTVGYHYYIVYALGGSDI